MKKRKKIINSLTKVLSKWGKRDEMNRGEKDF